MLRAKMAVRLFLFAILGCLAIFGGALLLLTGGAGCSGILQFPICPIVGISTMLAGGLLFNQGWHSSDLDPIPVLRHLATNVFDHQS
jgi:hypothetical protein